MTNTKQSKTEGVDWKAIRAEGVEIRKGLADEARAKATANAAALEARIAAQNHSSAFFALARKALDTEQATR